MELLVRGATDTDPQYVELGRCGGFNGAPSTVPVPLNTWTHIAATVDASNTVTYFVNGQPAGSWSAIGKDIGLGTQVNLGQNAGARRSHFIGPSILNEFPKGRTLDTVTLLDSFSSSAMIVSSGVVPGDTDEHLDGVGRGGGGL